MVALVLLACGDKEPWSSDTDVTTIDSQDTSVAICEIAVPSDARVVTGIEFNNDYQAAVIACPGADLTNNGPEATIYVATGALLRNYASSAMLYVEGGATVQNSTTDATITYAATADIGAVETYRTATECPGLLLTGSPCP
ncbi:MAG TPA: hypothetical protein QGF58_05120 [Myxococcota bacterium]|nr:hypothetical protein [Myxococcota bacterium]